MPPKRIANRWSTALCDRSPTTPVAKIRGAKTGPRRDLTLRIEIWPKGKATFGGGDLFELRFGAIVNYEEVQRFFMKVPIDELHYLRELSKSNPRPHVIEMEFDRTGECIRIIAGRVSKPVPVSSSSA